MPGKGVVFDGLSSVPWPEEVKQCGTKRSWKTRQRALIAMRRPGNRSVKVGRKLSVYRCEFCGRYHIGHERRA